MVACLSGIPGSISAAPPPSTVRPMMLQEQDSSSLIEDNSIRLLTWTRSFRADGVARAEAVSALAYAFGGSRRTARLHPRLDPLPDIGVDVLPVLEGPFEHLAADAAEQAARDLIDQLRPPLLVA